MADRTSNDLPGLMTTVDLAQRWGCTVGHLANLRSAGVGPTYLKIGGAVRYRMNDLLAYEQAHVVETG